jgi:hypothetical protein
MYSKPSYQPQRGNLPFFYELNRKVIGSQFFMLETTMIYTHVAGGGVGAQSPLDDL